MTMLDKDEVHFLEAKTAYAGLAVAKTLKEM